MMRLCCLSLSYAKQFNAGTMDIFKFLDTCRELNLDGVSVHIRNLHGTDKISRRPFRVAIGSYVRSSPSRQGASACSTLIHLVATF